jgi:hypothetical protein
MQRGSQQGTHSQQYSPTNSYVPRAPIVQQRQTSPRNAPQNLQLQMQPQALSRKTGQHLAIDDFSLAQYVDSHRRVRGMDPRILKLDVVIISASGIQTSLQYPDTPFIEIYISGFKSDHRFIDFERGNSTPFFHAGMTFGIVQPQHAHLILELWDHDITVYGEEPLGVAAVSLPKLLLREGTPVEMWLPFERPNKTMTGQVQVRITAIDFRYTESPHRDLIKGTNVRDITSIVHGNTSDYQAQMDSKYQPILVEDLAISGQTGDLLLFSGVRPQSRAIQLATSSIWSHVAIIIRNPPKHIRDLYNLSPHKSVFVLESDFFTMDKRFGGGVQLIEIEKWFKTAYLHQDPNTFMCLRRIRRTLQGPLWAEATTYEQSVTPFLAYVQNKPYENNPLELLGSLYSLNVQKKNLAESYFCSELATDLFKAIGAIQPTVISSNVTPHDLSTETIELNKIALPGVTWDNNLFRVKAKYYQVIGETVSAQTPNSPMWQQQMSQPQQPRGPRNPRKVQPKKKESSCTIL